MLAGPAAHAQTLVYDGVSGANPAAITATRTYSGQAFTISGNAGSSAAIQQVNVTLYNTGTTAYANTRVRVQFFGGFNSSTSPVFSAPLGATQVFVFGSVAAGSGQITASVPVNGTITLQTGTTYGIGFNWQASTDGTNFFDTDDLSVAGRDTGSTAITNGSNQSPSSNGGPGYYRNQSGRTDFNFLSTDARSLGANSGLVFSLSATPVPEPATVLLAGSLGLGALGYARRRTGRVAGVAVNC